jgi:hypothetical protein
MYHDANSGFITTAKYSTRNNGFVPDDEAAAMYLFTCEVRTCPCSNTNLPSQDSSLKIQRLYHAPPWQLCSSAILMYPE